MDVHILRQKYDLPERFFLYVGSLELRKNLQTIIEAMKVYKGSEPLIIVGASGWLNLDLRTMLAENQNKVRLIGYVPQEELPIFYNAALAFVYPSLYEGFGLPVIESMACGTPIITSNNSSLAEIGHDASLFLNDPTDPTELAETLARMAIDDNLQAELSEKGLIRATKFTPESAATATIRVYKHLLSMK